MIEEALESAGNIGIIHRLDNVLFSHAGLVRSFVSDYLDNAGEDIDDMINSINELGDYELWDSSSPVWARPQENRGYEDLYPEEYCKLSAILLFNGLPIRGICCRRIPSRHIKTENLTGIIRSAVLILLQRSGVRRASRPHFRLVLHPGEGVDKSFVII